MNNNRLFKAFRLIANKLNSRPVANYFGMWGFYSYVPQNCLTRISRLQIFGGNIVNSRLRYFSSCKKLATEESNSTANENSSNEHIRKALDDEEFQNILKDFARDFDVSTETSTVLEDIKKNKPENISTLNDTEDAKVSSQNISCYPSVESYKEFVDSDALVIHSYEDMQHGVPPYYHIDQEINRNVYAALKRGVHGVFDVHELIDVLRQENLADIATISVPKELHYTDFLILATAKSPRHCKAVTELIKKLYKRKKGKRDPFIIIEGEDVPNWKALDMGTIVLHVFLEDTRALYDIESLWLFDSNYDSGGNVQSDPMLEILEEQMAFFNSLKDTASQELSKDIR